MVARIVLLNGVGSAGKSSIARALQAIAATPFLHVEMDAFLAMLPPAYFGHPDGLVFTPWQTPEGPEIAISGGPVLGRAMRGMRHAVAALAEQGNDLIVDEVMIGAESAEYEQLLAGFHVMRVGVFATLPVLEAREQARGDRHIGLARWQFPRVHAGRHYDLEVDAGTASAEACARAIADRFGL
jgi:chloramphenicol 3-O phosphotransferase